MTLEQITEIAKWVGWAPIAALLIIVDAIIVKIYDNRIKLKSEQIESKDDTINTLEKKLKDCENLTPEILIKRLTETRENLTKEIEYMSNQSEQDAKKIKELQDKLDEVNAQLESQREIINRAQEYLNDMELPREGKFREVISSSIKETINTQQCIYIPVDIRSLTREKLLPILENHPYKLEVVFPGMHKTYLIFHNSLDEVIGFVKNPFTDIYDRDYYVTLLDYLKYVPSTHLYNDHEGYPTYEGSVDIFMQATFHRFSPVDPSIIFIKIPFDVNTIKPQG